MGNRPIWGLAERSISMLSARIRSLPNISEPCALYLATALSERKRFFIAPEVVIGRLQELAWLERGIFRLDLGHGVVWLNVPAIELQFRYSWRVQDDRCAELDEFCRAVFAHLQANLP